MSIFVHFQNAVLRAVFPNSKSIKNVNFGSVIEKMCSLIWKHATKPNFGLINFERLYLRLKYIFFLTFFCLYVLLREIYKTVSITSHVCLKTRSFLTKYFFFGCGSLRFLSVQYFLPVLYLNLTFLNPFLYWG